MKSGIVFATNNGNKLKEIRHLIGNKVNIKSLKEIGCFEELPETQNSLEGNALQKARYVKDKYGFDCFADDTGLEVVALDGRPGVYSARYAGPECRAEDNVKKLLQEMEEKDDRKARFRTVIALATDSGEQIFEGSVEGEILRSPRGEKGFGYDPVFLPEGYSKSFAEMELDEKNRISHRSMAIGNFMKAF